jgi:hypothetical protein
MSPPNPKRPPRSPRPPSGDSTARSDDVDLPFDDDEVAPLRADDPRPQRVPQFPVGPRRRPRRDGLGVAREERDRELPPARFSSGEYEDAHHARAFLYVERGPGAGQLVPIQQGALRLGRASTSDLRLQHPSISRRHAQLTRVGDRLTLKDLGSQNGTYVNRTRLTTERELLSGDEIALGNALLRVRGPGPTPARPPIPYSRSPSSLRVRMSGTRLMLLASASGALVAVFLMLPLVRWMRSLQQQQQALSQVERMQEPAVPSAPQEARPAPEADPVPGTPARRPSRPPAPTPRVKDAAPRPASEPVKASPSLPPEAEARTDAEILEQYEAGHVEQALALAQRARRDPLATLLSRFQEAWLAGDVALEAGDGAAALPHLQEARALDSRIARGWGQYNRLLEERFARARRLMGRP